MVPWVRLSAHVRKCQDYLRWNGNEDMFIPHRKLCSLLLRSEKHAQLFGRGNDQCFRLDLSKIIKLGALSPRPAQQARTHVPAVERAARCATVPRSFFSCHCQIKHRGYSSKQQEKLAGMGPTDEACEGITFTILEPLAHQNLLLHNTVLQVSSSPRLQSSFKGTSEAAAMLTTPFTSTSFRPGGGYTPCASCHQSCHPMLRQHGLRHVSVLADPFASSPPSADHLQQRFASSSHLHGGQLFQKNSTENSHIFNQSSLCMV